MISNSNYIAMGNRYSETDTEPSSEFSAAIERTPLQSIELCAIHMEYDGQPDELTIYPAVVADEFERMTQWITAVEGSWVDVEAMR